MMTHSTLPRPASPCTRWLAALGLPLFLALSPGCPSGPDESDGGPPVDAGPGDDGGTLDSGPGDSGPGDDGGTLDSGPGDAGPGDDGGPTDAGPSCGDGSCGGGETALDCPQDCATACASVDAICDPLATQPAGFVCVTSGATGLCRTVCATTGGPDPCPLDFFCLEEVSGAGGHCEPSPCDDFFTPNVCPTDRQCAPLRQDTWWCAATGSGAPTATCSADTECEAGTLCVDAACTLIDCAPLSGSPACTGDELCIGLERDGIAFDAGHCGPCLPYATSDGCPATEWCMPDFNTAGVGACIPDEGGQLTPFQSCEGTTPATSCAPGALCTAVFPTMNACASLCDPLAGTGELGVCPADHFCHPLASWGTRIGLCMETCTFNHTDPLAPTVPCASQAICQPKVAAGFGRDWCDFSGMTTGTFPLDAGDPCAASDESLPCRPGGICWDLGEGPTCIQLCDPSLGAFDDPMHPDCQPTGTVCANRFAAAPFGVCL